MKKAELYRGTEALKEVFGRIKVQMGHDEFDGIIFEGFLKCWFS
jgi:hypothetical protein